MWFTVYKDDDEAYNIWKNVIGVPEKRIQRGNEDNFWHMNIPGPCGPCSEIFIDRGSKYGKDGGPIGGGEDRFIEIWNLVFMESIQDQPFQVIDELPKKNIDTGTRHNDATAKRPTYGLSHRTPRACPRPPTRLCPALQLEYSPYVTMNFLVTAL